MLVRRMIHRRWDGAHCWLRAFVSLRGDDLSSIALSIAFRDPRQMLRIWCLQWGGWLNGVNDRTYNGFPLDIGTSHWQAMWFLSSSRSLYFAFCIFVNLFRVRSEELRHVGDLWPGLGQFLRFYHWQCASLLHSAFVRLLFPLLSCHCSHTPL